MNKLTTIILILLATALIGALGYFIFQNQKLIQDLSASSPSPVSQNTQTQSASPSSDPTTTPSPQLTTQATQNAIQTSIATKNFQGLLPYIADQVNFSLMSTDCCGPMTPEEAVEQMDYVSEGVPFDFNQNAEIASTLKAKNPQLSSTYIGVSTEKEHTAAFTIGEDNKITQIQLSVSWKLYDY